jgi:cell division protein FtsQ
MKRSLEAKKNRLRRRLAGSLGELLWAAALLSASVFVFVLFVLGYSALLSAPYFEIREVSIRGLKELTEKDILALAQIKPRSNILAVNTETVARRVAANAWVKKIYVGRELPNRLVLEVRERKPVALVKDEGHFYLMDSDGIVFKKLSTHDDVDLAILSGVNVSAKSQPPIVTDALRLLESLAGSERHENLGMVSEVHVSEVFGISLLTARGLHLKLGRDHFESKLRQLDVVLADLERRGMKDGHLLVDLADISKVTVQRKNAWGRPEDKKKGPQYKL